MRIPYIALCENLSPIFLRIVENERDELDFGLFRGIVYRTSVCRTGLSSAVAEQSEEVAMKYQAEQKNDDETANAEASSEAKAAATAASIFKV
jgi:hypothetical protein